MRGPEPLYQFCAEMTGRTTVTHLSLHATALINLHFLTPENPEPGIQSLPHSPQKLLLTRQICCSLFLGESRSPSSLLDSAGTAARTASARARPVGRGLVAKVSPPPLINIQRKTQPTPPEREMKCNCIRHFICKCSRKDNKQTTGLVTL